MKIKDIKKNAADGNIHHHSCILLALAVKNKGNWKGFLNDLNSGRKITDDEIVEFVNSCDFDGECTFLIDSDYPEAFKNLEQPPFVVFHKGNIAKLDEFISKNEFKKIIVSDSLNFCKEAELMITENPRHEVDAYATRRAEWLGNRLAEQFFKSEVICKIATA